jgi:hypothetical protein
MLLYIAGFLVNVLAPGNQKRLAFAEAESVSPVRAVLVSLEEAAKYVASNTLFPYVIAGMLLLPIFVGIVRKKDYRYPWPAFVTFLSFGVFAAQFVPTIYTIGTIGEGRVQNLYRWTFFLFLYGNELYWTGWGTRRYLQRVTDGEECGQDTRKSYLLPGWILGGIFLCYSLYVWGGDTLTSVSALNSLRLGQAQTYYEEYQKRLEVLEDESIRDAYLEPYTYYPYLLFFVDITDDPDDWVNGSVDSYYGKDSVTLIK